MKPLAPILARALAVLALALLATAPAWAQAEARASAGAVVDAEKAFAADARTMGDKRSFQKWAAPDAFVFAPEPVNAQENLAKEADDAGQPPLSWWPVWAGIARSGDLGFTLGPYSYDGQLRAFYFTVWARQADGSLKWIFDGGLRTDPRGAPGPLFHPDFLEMADGGAGSADAAVKEAAAAEADLARHALSSTRTAYLRDLADDGFLLGSASPPATRRSSFEQELMTRPPQMQFSQTGARASAAGDLVFTWGDARFEGGRAHYVRIWQKRPAGWKLVFDGLMGGGGG